MSVRLSGEINDLETERATLDAVLQKMTDGVLIVDAQGKVQLVNPAAIKMFSISQTISNRETFDRSGPPPPTGRNVAALPGLR